MVNLQQYPVWVDGVRLDTLAYSIETRNGRFNVPAMRGENLELAGRDGRLYVPNKRLEPGLLSLSMWCSDTDADGGNPGYEQFLQNYDTLIALFMRNNSMLHVRKQVASDGTERESYAEVSGAIAPDISGSHAHPVAKFTIGLELPGVFWQDTTDVVWSQTGAVSGTVYSPTGFGGGNAPMMDLAIEVTGPANNPRLVDGSTGHYVQLNHSLLGTEVWALNSGAWTSGIGATNMIGQTQYSGAFSPRLFGLSAGSQLRFEATGGITSATAIEVTGRRKYFT